MLRPRLLFGCAALLHDLLAPGTLGSGQGLRRFAGRGARLRAAATLAPGRCRVLTCRGAAPLRGSGRRCLRITIGGGSRAGRIGGPLMVGSALQEGGPVAVLCLRRGGLDRLAGSRGLFWGGHGCSLPPVG
ncbi:MAG: hypothetical protein CMI50_14015 [Paracoccus sp.]|nr:hypothetical protein [Paracoccus sp. (in: a-proteobacteria)]